ncbi:MAG: hypothetical protein RLZZ01_1592, partial [Actinomycetota bacterium]
MAVEHGRLGDEDVDPDVVRLHRHVRDDLGVEADPDDETVRPDPGQESVEPTTTLTEPVTSHGERDTGDQYDVDRSDIVGDVRRRHRLGQHHLDPSRP